MATPFDPERCPIPPIVRIPTTPLLVDSTVPEPPAEIIDCLDPLTPLASEPACPVINTQGTLNTGVPLSEAGVELVITKSNCCEFDLDLTLNLPDISTSCPAIVSPVRTVAYTDPEIAPGGTVQITAESDEDCNLTFDVELALHCPELIAPIPSRPVFFHSTGAGHATFFITRGPGCDYEFDFNLQAPCVVPAVSKVYPVVPSSSGTSSLRVAIVPGQDCTYDFDVELAVPCTDFTVIPTPIEWMPYSSLSAGAFELELTAAPDCDYTLQPTLTAISPGTMGLTDANGISARSGFTLGSGFVSTYKLNRFTGTLTGVASHVKAYNSALTRIANNKLVRLQLADGALMVSGPSEGFCVTTIFGRIVGGIRNPDSIPIPDCTLQVVGHITGTNYGTYAVPTGAYSIGILDLNPLDTSLDLYPFGPSYSPRFNAAVPLPYQRSVSAYCGNNNFLDIVPPCSPGYAYLIETFSPFYCQYPIGDMAWDDSLLGTGTAVLQGAYFYGISANPTWLSACFTASSFATGPGGGSCAARATTPISMRLGQGTSILYEAPTINNCPILGSCPSTPNRAIGIPDSAITSKVDPGIDLTIKFDCTWYQSFSNELFHNFAPRTFRAWEP